MPLLHSVFPSPRKTEEQSRKRSRIAEAASASLTMSDPSLSSLGFRQASAPQTHQITPLPLPSGPALVLQRGPIACPKGAPRRASFLAPGIRNIGPDRRSPFQQSRRPRRGTRSTFGRRRLAVGPTPTAQAANHILLAGTRHCNGRQHLPTSAGFFKLPHASARPAPSWRSDSRLRPVWRRSVRRTAVSTGSTWARCAPT